MRDAETPDFFPSLVLPVVFSALWSPISSPLLSPPPQTPTSLSLLWSVLTVQGQEDSGPGICSNEQRYPDPGSRRLGAFPLPPAGAQWPCEADEWVKKGSFQVTFALPAFGGSGDWMADIPVSFPRRQLFVLGLVMSQETKYSPPPFQVSSSQW